MLKIKIDGFVKSLKRANSQISNFIISKDYEIEIWEFWLFTSPSNFAIYGFATRRYHMNPDRIFRIHVQPDCEGICAQWWTNGVQYRHGLVRRSWFLISEIFKCSLHGSGGQRSLAGSQSSGCDIYDWQFLSFFNTLNPGRKMVAARTTNRYCPWLSRQSGKSSWSTMKKISER